MAETGIAGHAVAPPNPVFLFKNEQMLFAINNAALLASTAVLLNHAGWKGCFEEGSLPILNRLRAR
ncbi:hypothetical protein [Neorhizobium alkalisoli]|uniref:hypothetical protein n=1 Tax=Neorhizobium alkalisoli TaxID=528178 RepID=UPI0011A00F43|nr:hypothetical protein [Neorhizobium alkalisoli]